MSNTEIRKWFIIGCLRCHLLQIVRSDQKSRRCIRCGYTMPRTKRHLNFHKIKIWFKAENVKDAQFALQKLKLKQKAGLLKGQE
jgi:Zn ribbon nucleic-acid-binding protein